MTAAPADCLWPLGRLDEALATVAAESDLPHRARALPRLPEHLVQHPDGIAAWLEAAAASLAIEVESLEAPYADLERLVLGCGPALLPLEGPDGRGVLGVLRRRGRSVEVLRPDRTRARVAAAAVVRALTARLTGAVGREVDALLDTAGVRPSRRAAVREALLRERHGGLRFGGCFSLRPAPGSSFFAQIRHARLLRHLAAFAGAHLCAYLLMLASWWVLGSAALGGLLDRGALVGWALMVASGVPLGALMAWSQGMFALGVGGLLKQRLLVGALRLDPDRVRDQGAGQLLGRVMESTAVESMALSAGLGGVVAVIEVAGAATVLALGPGGWLRLLVFLGWIALTLAMGHRYYRLRGRWTGARLEMTNDLVERMVGHRTRLAQERPERWHDGEDELLARYLDLSARLDGTAVRFGALLTRGWMVAGLASLAPLLLGAAPAAASIAVAIGGVMLGARALGEVSSSLGALIGALVAWEQVRPLYRAAADPERPGTPDAAIALTDGAPAAADEPPVLQALDVSFRYRDRAEPVLRGASLVVRRGERVLLEGPSGGGKTTLAAVLMALREPENGLLLLRGFDRQTVGGEAWRRRVVGAPQFHENHVFTGTFSFNLLMGRGWPPRAEELAEAEQVCRELGLGPLLERMPAGLEQIVGETGWRLSHGERSRLFMARALLQDADLVILDESFAALDPESLSRAMECTLRRARTLLVIAHP